MSILFIKNIDHEAPGLYGELMSERGLGYETIRATDTVTLPDPGDYRAIIILGGPQSANDSTPQITRQIEFIGRCLDIEVPMLAVCLGVQLLAKASGGRVVQIVSPEVGWRGMFDSPYMIELTDEGKTDPLLKGFTDSTPIFQLHGETIELNDRMVLLASGRQCHNQLIRIGKYAYGIQGHFELTRGMLESWLGIDAYLKKADQAGILKTYDIYRDQYRANSRRFFRNFLAIAGLIE